LGQRLHQKKTKTVRDGFKLLGVYIDIKEEKSIL
jgi:hypothetical protein